MRIYYGISVCNNYVVGDRLIEYVLGFRHQWFSDVTLSPWKDREHYRRLRNSSSSVDLQEILTIEKHFCYGEKWQTEKW